MNCGSTTSDEKPLEVEAIKEPAFQPGDYVRGKVGWLDRGRVVKVGYIYHVEDEDTPGESSEYEEDEIETLVMTESEAWTDAVLLIHGIVESSEFEFPGQYSRQYEADKEIRHRVYQFLGGNNVKVTEAMRGDSGSVQRVIDRIRKQRKSL